VLFYVVESTLQPCPVTAEAAGSSPVVPAIHSKGVIGRDNENSNLQFNPLLLHRRIHPHSREELALGSPRFVAVFLRVEIKCGLNLRVPENPLHRLGFDLRLVH
jgi:hypothetical protein